MKNVLKILLAFVFAAIAPVAFAESFSLENFAPVAIDAAQGTFNISNNVLHLNSTSPNGIFIISQPFAWNGELSARIQRSSPDVKIGVVFLQTSNSILPGAGMFLSANNTTFERHLTATEPRAITTLTNETPHWLRVVREGTSFNGFYSDDGTNWIQLSADTIEMPNKIFAGFVISGVGEAQIQNVQLTSAHLVSPIQTATFMVPTNILLKPEISGDVRQVEFFSNAKTIGKAAQHPFTVNWTNALAGSHWIVAKITGNSGEEFFTEPINCEISLPPASAKFVRVDDVTRGGWKSNYGAEGFLIVQHATNFPDYAAVSSSGHKSILMKYSKEPGSLQLTNENGGIVAQWFTYTNMTVNVSVLDGRAHQVAFYLQDPDSNLRVQQIELTDAGTGTVLDIQKAAEFHFGKYFVWEIRGAVKFRITRLTGNAVLSGIFFDAVQCSETARQQ